MKKKKIPMRKCVGCMESKPKKELLRMTSDHGKIKVDATGKSNGRGIYLCRDKNCFNLALKRKSIERGLKAELNEEELEEILKFIHMPR